MPFNGTGTYLTPAGNPVATGTVIQSAWANGLVNDVAATFTNVLPRDGQASMIGQLKIADGNNAVPGMGFNSESATGVFRPTAGAIALSAGGSEVLRGVQGARILLGTNTDDGINRLQVSGNIVASGSLVAVRFTGNVNATTAALGTLTVSGTSAFTGNTALGNLVVSGSSTLAAVHAASADFSGNVTIGTGASSIAASGDLTVRRSAASGTGAIYFGSGASSIYFDGSKFVVNSPVAVDATYITGTAAGLNIGGNAVSAITQSRGTANTAIATTAFVDVWRSMPVSSNSGNPVLSDRGLTVVITAGATIPANVFAAGDIFTFYNNTGSALTLTQGSGLTLRQAGTTNTGNRQISSYGFACVWFLSATEAVISGNVT
jgi:hypothetical protein